MSADEPPAYTLDAVTTALDEDAARDWLEQWRAASRQLRTLMESDIAQAALARNRNDPQRRIEQRRFREIIDNSDL